jgi:hypothetical protein
MGDAEVYGKLSRIFETHGFGADDSALDDILEDFDPSVVYGQPESPSRTSPNKPFGYAFIAFASLGYDVM